MNKIVKWLIRRKIKQLEKKGGGIMILLKILGWVVKNVAYIVGIMDTIVKLIAGIVSMTPTKKDDKFRDAVDRFFNVIKCGLYRLSDLLGK